MLIIFSGGPECLIDEPGTISRMARGLRHPDGLALCFKVPYGRPGSTNVITTIGETSQRLREILTDHWFPVYRSRFRPVSLPPTNGQLGIWVRMRPGDTSEDWVHDRPLRKPRTRSSC